MNLSRRGLITGLISFVAAPAIVRAASLMPVKALEAEFEFSGFYSLYSTGFYGEMCAITREAFVPRLFVSVYDIDPSLSFLRKSK
jgi:hypothetical protein